VRAVVLLGGAGTRLRPLTRTTPKQVLPIVEVPMIERVLAHLASHGVDEAVLSLGYLHDAFVLLFPDARLGGVSLTWAVEPEPLDTAGAVAFAAAEAGIDSTFLVVNGDVLTDLDVSAMVEFHHRRAAEATISLAVVPDPSAFGLVEVDAADGRVLQFVEKPTFRVAGPGQVSAGTYVLEPSVLHRIPPGRRVSIEREVFPALVEKQSLYGFASPDYWTDTGTPAQYLQAHLDLLSGLRPGPPAPGAVPKGDAVWTLGDAVVDGEVRGPALVGSAAFVGRDAVVEASVIGSGARVHGGARVHESVLLPGSVVRAGAVVSRSVLGEQAVVGEDAHLSGLTVVGAGTDIPAGSRLEGARVPADG
jgi:mannose-1-phosphate guanylyltransferase